MVDKIVRTEYYGEHAEDPKFMELIETLGTQGVHITAFLKALRWRDLLDGGDYRKEVPNIQELSRRARFPKILKETVLVSTSLIEQKVISDVVEGMEEFAEWREMCRVIEMGKAQKIEIPIIDSSSFSFKEGTQGTAARSMQGEHAVAELDASAARGLYRGELHIPKYWIRDANYDAIGETLSSAGREVGRTVQKKVIDDLITNAGQTGTADSLDSATKLSTRVIVEVVDNKLPTNGYACDLAIMHPADLAFSRGESTSGVFPFLSNTYQGELGRDGSRGLFFNGVKGPVRILMADGASATSGTVMFTNRQNALALGLKQDLTIEEFDDIREGIEGAILTMQIVTAEIRDKASFKVTAWTTYT